MLEGKQSKSLIKELKVSVFSSMFNYGC